MSKVKSKKPIKVTKKKLALFAGMVIYNEADKLEKWLEAHPFIPNIIVIDQGSTDGTLEILQADSRVVIHKTTRFEGSANSDYSLLTALVGDVGMIIMAPDEYITEAHYKEVVRIVTNGFLNFGVRAFYISRKNFIDNKDMSKYFIQQGDPTGKDWKLRICLGNSIKFNSSPRTNPTPAATWAYIDDEKAYLTHNKTIKEEQESMEKRSINLSKVGKTLDIQYMKQVMAEMEVK